MLEITTSTYNEAEPDYDSPANLVSNDFLPFRSLNFLDRRSSDFINFTKTYYKPSITSSVRVKSTSSTNILQSLTYEGMMTKYVFTSQVYFIGKGMVLDSEGKILLLLTVKKTSLENYSHYLRDFDEYENDFSYDNFILFTASELACTPSHSVFYRRIQKIYLDFCYQKGMEVRFLPSSIIEKNTFASSLNLSFNSVSELDYHLRNEVQFFLMQTEEDAQERSLHINIPPVDIVVEPVVLRNSLESSGIFPIDDLEEHLQTVRQREQASIMDSFDTASIPNRQWGSLIVNSSTISGNEYYQQAFSSNNIIRDDGTRPSTYISGVDPYTLEAVNTPLPPEVDDDIIEF